MREYSSFDEVDRDLKILKLQALIDKEELKMSYGRIKHNLRPISLAGSVASSIARNAIVVKAVAKLSDIKKVFRNRK